MKYLSHGLHIAYHRSVLDFVEKQQAVNEYMASELAAYKAAFEQERVLYPYRRGSGITKQMEQARQQRTELFVGLKYTVKAAAFHWEAERREAARTLLMVIEHFGALYVQNMIGATANAGLLVSTSRKQYAGQVALLDLGGWLDKLEEANNRFNE